MIHGKTKIELYNPKTKIKNVIREENTFQSGVIANALRNLGNAATSPYNNVSPSRQTPEWTDIVGGLLLFENAETVGNLYAAKTNKMVGNGAYGVSNSGEPNELGSYNSSESSYSPSAITQVYDFSTSQANGSISCVCLTSQTGGFCGYGNESGGYFDNMNNYRNLLTVGSALLAPQRLNRVFSSDVSGTRYRFIVFKGILYYISSYSSNKLIIKKARVPLVTGSIFDEIYEEIELDVTGSGIQNLNVGFWSDNDKLYILYEQSRIVAAGANDYYFEYDVSNDTITLKSIENTLQNSMSIASASIAGGCMIYKVSSSAKLEVFDLSTNIHNCSVNLPSNSEGISIFCTNSIAGRVSAMIRLFSQAYVMAYINIDNGSIIYTNASWDDNVYGSYVFYDNYTDAMIIPSRYGITAINSPFYLATINNLQSSVTKTAAQTMKVTYTLSES